MREQIFTLVGGAVSDLNDELQYTSLEDLNDSTSLFGGEDGIDSLSLVRLIVDVEQRVKEETGRSVSLTNENAMSARRSPYRTVGALTDFIVEHLGD